MDVLPSFADPANLEPSIGFEDDEDSIELPPGALSLEFLQAIYRSAKQPMARRMKAASIAIGYESPKLAVTAVVEGSDSLAARLNRAIERSARVEAYRLIQAARSLPASGSHIAFMRRAIGCSSHDVRNPVVARAWATIVGNRSPGSLSAAVASAPPYHRHWPSHRSR